MFKLSETSSQGYQVVIKPKTQLKLLGGAATINEQKRNKALFNMFGLQL